MATSLKPAGRRLPSCGPLNKALSTLFLLLVMAGCGDTSTHALNPGEQRAAIATLATQIEAHYLDPAAARTMAAALRAGDYAGIHDAAGLALRLSRDLQQVSHDPCLRVETLPQAPWWRRLRDPAGITWNRIGADIGYIDIASFYAPDRAAAPYAKVFGKLADTHTIIVDLRHNGGGDADGLQLLASYVIDRPIHYADLAHRNGVIDARWAYPQLAARPYLEQLMILVGPRTSAEAENFAYAMQAWKRATVIGSRSAGVTTASTSWLIADHLVAVIPDARVTLPLTHRSWDGGVHPDVATGGDALTEAKRRILQDRLTHVTTPMGRQALLALLHDLDSH